MEARNVTELTEVTSITDTDSLLVGRSNSLRRISFANVKTLLKTIIGNATTTVAGLMAAADKQHLDALYTKLGNVTVDTTLQNSNTSLPTGSAVNVALADYNKTFYGYSGSKYNLVISLNRLNHLGLMIKTENNNGNGSIYYITQNQNYKLCGDDLTITKDTTANTITVRLVTNYCYCLIENISQNGTVASRTLIQSFAFS